LRWEADLAIRLRKPDVARCAAGLFLQGAFDGPAAPPLPRLREVSLLVQSHLKRDPAARSSDRLDPQPLSAHRAGR